MTPPFCPADEAPSLFGPQRLVRPAAKCCPVAAARQPHYARARAAAAPGPRAGCGGGRRRPSLTGAGACPCLRVFSWCRRWRPMIALARAYRRLWAIEQPCGLERHTNAVTDDAVADIWIQIVQQRTDLKGRVGRAPAQATKALIEDAWDLRLRRQPRRSLRRCTRKPAGTPPPPRRKKQPNKANSQETVAGDNATRPRRPAACQQPDAQKLAKAPAIRTPAAAPTAWCLLRG